MRLVHGPSERSQVPHHRPVSRANQGVGIITCSYCYQMGYMFHYCPFVDDRLSSYLRKRWWMFINMFFEPLQ
jgi:hypothetical protein